jgi:hypothetical protein
MPRKKIKIEITTADCVDNTVHWTILDAEDDAQPLSTGQVQHGAIQQALVAVSALGEMLAPDAEAVTLTLDGQIICFNDARVR